MVRITWEDKEYEVGVDRGAYYPKIGSPQAWNGLVSIADASLDSDEVVNHVDGIKYRNQRSTGSFAASVEAIYCPNHLLDNMSKTFGLSYRTMIGSEGHYKIHLVYNALVTPESREHQQDDTSPMIFGLYTTPIQIQGIKASAHLIIDTRVAYSWAVEALEELLYGTDEASPYWPTPQEVLTLFENASILKITDNGDGTWTAEGPDDVVYFTDATTFEIDWTSVVYIDAISYTVHSL